MLEKVAGVVLVKKLWSILLLKADPRKDIAAVRQLEALILRGEVLGRKRLDALLRDNTHAGNN